MSDAILALVAEYGVALVAIAAFASCLAVPIPTGLIMLAAGAFVASGDLVAWQVALAAFAAAVAGDQTGFRIGRLGGARLGADAALSPRRAALLGRARRVVDRWGGVGVFFSTWLFAPLGPWVNLIAGATGLNWLRFTLWDAAGEAIWVGFYLGIGYLFAGRIVELASVLGNSVGLLVASLASMVLGLMLFRERQRMRRAVEEPDTDGGASPQL